MLPRRWILALLFVPVLLVVALIFPVIYAVNRAKPSWHLTGEEHLTLYSIDPVSNWPAEKTPEGETFHKYAVLGKLGVRDDRTRKQIADSINDAVAKRSDSQLKCFEPRHGLRATANGETRDFLICFECLNMSVYGRGGVQTGTTITADPKPLFNKILSDAGIKLAPERGKN